MVPPTTQAIKRQKGKVHCFVSFNLHFHTHDSPHQIFVLCVYLSANHLKNKPRLPDLAKSHTSKSDLKHYRVDLSCWPLSRYHTSAFHPPLLNLYRLEGHNTFAEGGFLYCYPTQSHSCWTCRCYTEGSKETQTLNYRFRSKRLADERERSRKKRESDGCQLYNNGGLKESLPSCESCCR